MRYKRLGRTGLKVSEICLGCLTFGDQADAQESRRIVDKALAAGVNFFDVADVYLNGKSESILGEVLKGRRQGAVIATKLAGRMGDGPNDEGLSRKHVLDAVDASLRRLQTDYVDVYQVHRWDPNTPIEETLIALNDLVRAGKVRYLGCSNFAAWQLTKSLWVSDVRNLARFDALQPRYNLLVRAPEEELLPLCLYEGVGVMAYNPLGGGLLTGKQHKGAAPLADTRFGLREVYRNLYWHDQNLDAVERLRDVAKRTGKSMLHLALGWVLAQPAVTSAIVGASRASQLDESLAVADAPLSASELDACASATVGGVLGSPTGAMAR